MTASGALPRLTFDETKRLIAEASDWIPGGTSSDYRLGAGALVVDWAQGALLRDADGNRLIDYFCGAGPIILGHNPPAVVEAVTRQLNIGVQVGGETRDEFAAARLMRDLVPCGEMTRFANTGSEAVQLALRLARGATGRDVVVKFEGHYHGWLDSVFVGLPSQARGTAAGGRRIASAGQDAAAIEHTEVLPWNDLEAVDQRLARGDVAAVMTEPLWRGYIAPQPGYLAGLREICTRRDVILIFDEIVSGFRASPGGAQELFGVTPDLATFAKAMANGFPIGAVAGRGDLMRLMGGGPVVHPGTYNGNALVMAAAVATLGLLADGSPYEAIDRAGGRLITGFAGLLERRGIRGVVQGVPGSFHINLGIESPIRDIADVATVDMPATQRLSAALLERGIRANPGGHWYLMSAHTDDLVDETLTAFEDALTVIQ